MLKDLGFRDYICLKRVCPLGALYSLNIDGTEFHSISMGCIKKIEKNVQVLSFLFPLKVLILYYILLHNITLMHYYNHYSDPSSQ